MKERFRQYLRIAALVTLVAYVPTNLDLAYASVGLEIPALSQVKLDQSLGLGLPSELGKMESLSPGIDGTILHIQTAHGHFEAQEKIEKILTWLTERYGQFPLFLEGAADQLDISRLEFFPGKPDVNFQNAKWLQKKSLVTGSETFLLRNKNLKGYGVETPEDYKKNHDQFVRVLKAKENTAYFSDLFKQNMEKAAAIFSPELRSFLKRLEQHVLGIVPLDVWLMELHKNAASYLKVDFNDPAWQVHWPMMVRFFKIRSLSEKLDAAQYEVEKEKFLNYLRKVFRSRPELAMRLEVFLESMNQSIQLPEPETEDVFVEMLRYLPRDFDFQDFPQIAYFIGTLVLRSQLDSAQFADEIDRIESLIAEKLTRNEAEKELLSLFSNYRLLEKTFELQLNPSEFEKVQEVVSSQKSIYPSRLAEELFREGLETQMTRDQLRGLDRVFEEAVEFYRGAQKRDRDMILNIEKNLQKNPAKFAVVVTGGFHSEPMRKHFENEGYGYGVVTPSISGLDEEGYRAYLKAMRATLFSEQSMPSNSMIELAQGSDPTLGLQTHLRRLILTVRRIRAGELLKGVVHGWQGASYDGEVFPTGAQLAVSRAEQRWKNPNAQKILVVGTGFVGATKAILQAIDFGHDVIALDVVREKLDKLQDGELPFEAEHLPELLREVIEPGRELGSGRLTFTDDYASALEDRPFVYLALPTPQSETGEADTKYLEAAVRTIAENLKPGERKILIGKSTAPPKWTVERLRVVMEKVLERRRQSGEQLTNDQIQFAWEPEFLREAKEVEDDRGEAGRIVIGAETPEVAQQVAELYSLWNPDLNPERRKVPVILTDIVSAPLVKYAANGYRGLKISFISFLSWLTEELGFDINEIAHEIGLDSRIIRAFLTAGPGFGGSCFPKDLAAFIKITKELGVSPGLILDVLAVNHAQINRFIKKMDRNLGGFRDKKVVLLGGAFKAGTSDTRESRAVVLAKKLIADGAQVVVVDPAARQELEKIFKDYADGDTSPITFYDSVEGNYEAIFGGADAVAVMTEWPEFKRVDFNLIRSLFSRDEKLPSIFDGRNLFGRRDIEQLGFEYFDIGRGKKPESVSVEQHQKSKEEFIELARELFLVLRISYINIIAEVAEKLGANILDVKRGFGYDPVVFGYKEERGGAVDYLDPGIGWGGHDLAEALSQIENLAGINIVSSLGLFNSARTKYLRQFQVAGLPESDQVPFVDVAREINANQIAIHIAKIKEILKTDDLRGKTISVMGLSYKPRGTYSIKGSPSVELIKALFDEGVIVHAWDPEAPARASVKSFFYEEGISGEIKYFGDPHSAMRGSDVQVVVHVTDEDELTPEKFVLDAEGKPVASQILDARHVFPDPGKIRALGIGYHSIGVPSNRSEARKNFDELMRSASGAAIFGDEDFQNHGDRAPLALGEMPHDKKILVVELVGDDTQAIQRFLKRVRESHLSNTVQNLILTPKDYQSREDLLAAITAQTQTGDFDLIIMPNAELLPAGATGYPSDLQQIFMDARVDYEMQIDRPVDLMMYESASLPKQANLILGFSAEELQAGLDALAGHGTQVVRTNYLRVLKYLTAAAAKSTGLDAPHATPFMVTNEKGVPLRADEIQRGLGVTPEIIFEPHADDALISYLAKLLLRIAQAKKQQEAGLPVTPIEIWTLIPDLWGVTEVPENMRAMGVEVIQSLYPTKEIFIERFQRAYEWNQRILQAYLADVPEKEQDRSLVERMHFFKNPGALYDRIQAGEFDDEIHEVMRRVIRKYESEESARVLSQAFGLSEGVIQTRFVDLDLPYNPGLGGYPSVAKVIREMERASAEMLADKLSHFDEQYAGQIAEDKARGLKIQIGTPHILDSHPHHRTVSRVVDAAIQQSSLAGAAQEHWKYLAAWAGGFNTFYLETNSNSRLIPDSFADRYAVGLAVLVGELAVSRFGLPSQNLDNYFAERLMRVPSNFKINSVAVRFYQSGVLGADLLRHLGIDEDGVFDETSRLTNPDVARVWRQIVSEGKIEDADIFIFKNAKVIAEQIHLLDLRSEGRFVEVDKDRFLELLQSGALNEETIEIQLIAQTQPRNTILEQLYREYGSKVEGVLDTGLSYPEEHKERTHLFFKDRGAKQGISLGFVSRILVSKSVLSSRSEKRVILPTDEGSFDLNLKPGVQELHDAVIYEVSRDADYLGDVEVRLGADGILESYSLGNLGHIKAGWYEAIDDALRQEIGSVWARSEARPVRLTQDGYRVWTVGDAENGFEVTEFGAAVIRLWQDGADQVWQKEDGVKVRQEDSLLAVPGSIPLMLPANGRTVDKVMLKPDGTPVNVSSVPWLREAGKHMLHGFTDKLKWRLAEASDESVSLKLKASEVVLGAEGAKTLADILGGDVEFTQTYAMKDGSLTSLLKIKNLSGHEIVLGGGYHPFYQIQNLEDWTIQIPASQVWAEGSEPLDLQAEPNEVSDAVDFRNPQPLRYGMEITLGGLAANTEVILRNTKTGEERKISFAAKDFPYLLLWVPAKGALEEGVDIFSVEPLLSIPNGRNMYLSGNQAARPLVLAPHETHKLTWSHRSVPTRSEFRGRDKDKGFLYWFGIAGAIAFFLGVVLPVAVLGGVFSRLIKADRGLNQKLPKDADLIWPIFEKVLTPLQDSLAWDDLNTTVRAIGPKESIDAVYGAIHDAAVQNSRFVTGFASPHGEYGDGVDIQFAASFYSLLKHRMTGRSEMRVEKINNLKSSEEAQIALSVIADKYGVPGSLSGAVRSAFDLGADRVLFFLGEFSGWSGQKQIKHQPGVYLVVMNGEDAVYHFDGYRDNVNQILIGESSTGFPLTFAALRADGFLDVFVEPSVNGVLQKPLAQPLFMRYAETVQLGDAPEGQPVHGMMYLYQPSDSDSAPSDIQVIFENRGGAVSVLRSEARNDFNDLSDLIALKRLREAVTGDLQSLDPAGFALIPNFGQAIDLNKIPDGYAIGVDIGGTNFRFRVIQKQDGKIKDVYMTPSIKIPDEVKTAKTTEDFFDFYAEEIRRVLEQEVDLQLQLKDRDIPLGFTFSFEVDQTALNQGIVRKPEISKGFVVPDLVGKNVVQGFQEALNRKLSSLGVRFHVNALLNDTTATALAAPDTVLGLILGTGFNIAALLPEEMIGKIAEQRGLDPQQVREMFINLEAGNTGRQGWIDEYRSRADEIVDEQSENKGDHLFEKMVSGAYLGQIVAAQLWIDFGNTQGRVIPDKLKKLDIPAIELAEFIKIKRREGNVAAATFVFEKWGLFIDGAEADQVELIIKKVASRSAALVAANIAGIIKAIDPELKGKYRIAVDGSVYLKNSQYQKQLTDHLYKILGDEAWRIEFVPAADGSSRGAALLAAQTGIVRSEQRLGETAEFVQERFPKLNDRRSLDDARKILLELLGKIVPRRWLQGVNHFSLAQQIEVLTGRPAFAESVRSEQRSILQTMHPEKTYAVTTKTFSSDAKVILDAQFIEILLEADDVSGLVALLKDAASLIVFDISGNLKQRIKNKITNRDSRIPVLQQSGLLAFADALTVVSAEEASLYSQITDYAKAPQRAVLLSSADGLQRVKGKLVMALNEALRTGDTEVLRALIRVLKQAVSGAEPDENFLYQQIDGLDRRDQGWLATSVQKLIGSLITNYQLVEQSA